MITQKNRIALFVAFLCLIQEVLAHEKARIEHIPQDEETVANKKNIKGR